MTQQDIVRELRSGLPIHRHSGDPEPRLSPLSVSCVHTIMSTAANLIETLAADRDGTMRENADLLKEVMELQAERNALIEELKNAYSCFACKKFYRNGGECKAGGVCMMRNFEWRGVQKEE